MPCCYKDINLFGKEILKVVNYKTNTQDNRESTKWVRINPLFQFYQ
jgi:hypothetical protein